MCSCGCPNGTESLPLEATAWGQDKTISWSQVTWSCRMIYGRKKASRTQGKLHVYFSSGYAGAFPWKIVPMPYLDGKILNESVSWRHPEGDGVFLTGKATREPSWQLCAIPATAPFRADCRIGESCLGKQDRPGLKHWFLVQVSQWNVNEKFSTSSCPDSPCQNLWSPRLGQRTSISGGHPARVAPWIVFCAVPVSCVSFSPEKKKPPSTWLLLYPLALGWTRSECQEKRVLCKSSPLNTDSSGWYRTIYTYWIARICQALCQTLRIRR